MAETQVDRIRGVLAAKPSKSFTVDEVAEASGVSRAHVSTVLPAEAKAGRVRRVKPGVYKAKVSKTATPAKSTAKRPQRPRALGTTWTALTTLPGGVMLLQDGSGGLWRAEKLAL